MNLNGFIYKQLRSLYLYQNLSASYRKNIKTILMQLEKDHPEFIEEYGDWHEQEPVTPAPTPTPTPVPDPTPSGEDASPVVRKGIFEAPLFYKGTKETMSTWEVLNQNVSDADRELCIANIKKLTASGNTGFLAVVPTQDCGMNLYKGSSFQGTVNKEVQAFYKKWCNRFAKENIQICITPYCDDPNKNMLWWPKVAEHEKFIKDLYAPISHLKPWFCLSIESNELAYNKGTINSAILVMKKFLPGVTIGCHLQIEGRSRVAPNDYAWLTDANNTSPADTDFILVEYAGPPQNGKNKSLSDIKETAAGLAQRQTIKPYIVHEWYLESFWNNNDYIAKRDAIRDASKGCIRFIGRG